MQSIDLQADARGLLAVRIRTIEQVDVLLWLRDSERAFSVPELVTATELHAEQISSALMHLIAHGLVLVRADGYLYAPANPMVDRAVAALARINREDRAGLLALLSSSALERVRDRKSEFIVEMLAQRRRGGS